jgi:hypothetical protein
MTTDKPLPGSVSDGGPAFPNSIAIGPAGDVAWSNEGISIRDWFAGQAPALEATNMTVRKLCGIGEEEPIADWYAAKAKAHAIWSYQYADAMLAHRQAAKP